MGRYLAIDIGASSGRHIIGDDHGNLEEVYRFKTGFKNRGGHLVNDIDTLLRNVLIGIRKAFARHEDITSLSIDTWGVDYVLMNGDREIYPAYAYRDDRTKKAIEDVHALMPFEELYFRSGIQFHHFNTLYQLYADMLEGRLEKATDYLMLPEYLIYKLTGVKTHEYTDETTGGYISLATHSYDMGIIDKLGLPSKLFGEILQPGTYVGQLKEEVARYVKGNCKVLLCASHDTASAVEGIPMDEDEPYISSGTWSLLGVKVTKGLNGSPESNYSNEGGVGYTRYQKNIMGMWIVNRLKRELAPFTDLRTLIAEAEYSSFEGTVDVNEERFLQPKSMKKAFDEALGVKGLKVADYFNSAIRSLAIGYKKAIEELEANTGKKYNRLYIVGGGAKNKYLNALTEEYTGLKVIALPIEATALGNIKIQKEHCKQ